MRPIVGYVTPMEAPAMWSILLGIVIVSAYYAAKSIYSRIRAAKEQWNRIRGQIDYLVDEMNRISHRAIAAEQAACEREGRSFDEERFLADEWDAIHGLDPGWQERAAKSDSIKRARREAQFETDRLIDCVRAAEKAVCEREGRPFDEESFCATPRDWDALKRQYPAS